MKETILKALRFKNRKKRGTSDKGDIGGAVLSCLQFKAYPYKRMLKATKEHQIVSNQLNRKFKQNTPLKTFLTDITYLSTILDGSTNEILAYHVSEQMTLELVTTTLHKLKRNLRIQLIEGVYIHSDQGAHYTSPTYQKLVRKLNLGQSMSRRGNCWDNAPQESFYLVI